MKNLRRVLGKGSLSEKKGKKTGQLLVLGNDSDEASHEPRSEPLR